MRGRCVTWIACISHCPRAIAEPMLRAALIHLWSLLRRLKQAEGDDRVHWSQLVAMACVLCGRLCPDWKADYVQVDELLSQAVRASSAVEGVNSVVRHASEDGIVMWARGCWTSSGCIGTVGLVKVASARGEVLMNCSG